MKSTGVPIQGIFINTYFILIFHCWSNNLFLFPCTVATYESIETQKQKPPRPPRGMIPLLFLLFFIWLNDTDYLRVIILVTFK